MRDFTLQNLPAGVSDKPILFDESNIAELQTLYARCPDYFEMASGHPATPDAAMEDLTAGPPERVPQDIFCYGITDHAGLVVATICFVRHHRQPDQWYLTLLLIDPAHRAAGWGHAIYAAFEPWLIGEGARSVLLAVFERNTRARAFWESNGFTFRHCFADVEIDDHIHDLWEYEKHLAGPLCPN